MAAFSSSFALRERDFTWTEPDLVTRMSAESSLAKAPNLIPIAVSPLGKQNSSTRLLSLYMRTAPLLSATRMSSFIFPLVWNILHKFVIVLGILIAQFFLPLRENERSILSIVATTIVLLSVVITPTGSDSSSIHLLKSEWFFIV